MVQPNEISGLKMWLDAKDINLPEGSNVLTWNGKGGTTVNAVGSSKPPTVKTLDENKYVYFDGTIAQRMDLSENIFTNNTPMTIFIALHGVKNGHIVGFSTSTTPYYTYLKGVALQGGKYGASARVNSTGALVETIDSDYQTKKKPELLTITIDNQNTSIKTLSENKVTNSTSNIATHTYTKATIGASDGSNSNSFVEPFGGYIREIIVYNRVLTAQETKQVEDYMFKMLFSVNKILLSSGDGKLKSLINVKAENQPKLNGSVVSTTAIGGSNAQKTLDSTETVGWRGYSGVTSWIKYEFIEAISIDHFKIHSYYSAGYEAIKNFNIEGSNTGFFTGEEVIIYKGSHPNETTNDFVTYSFINENKYKFYRINILDVYVGNGGNNVSIVRVEFRKSKKVIKYISGTPTEDKFIKYGTSLSEITGEMSEEFFVKDYIQDTTTALGSGKVFEHVLDLNKVLRKITINID